MCTEKPEYEQSSRENGFTLVEILVSMVLLSILVFGASTMFARINHHFFKLNLKQKAVLILNGEMARLYGAFSHGNPPDSQISTNYPATRTGVGTVTHLIYTEPSALTVNSGFIDADREQSILFYDPSGSDDPLNVVWIDQEKRIVGRLGWVETDTGKECYDSVNPAATCKLITVYLDYPYRYEDATHPLVEDMGPVQTLVLRTIVGER